MALSFKPRGIHSVLVVLAIGIVVLAVGWRNSLRETDRVREANRALSARIAALEEEATARRREIDDSRDATEKVISDLEQQIAGLSDARDRLHAELEEKTGGFAIPTGFIRWIDPVGRKVWINLGEVDRLKPRTTFNVLKGTRTRVTKGTLEMGVGTDDVKGAIEVTRLLEDHLAEARILNALLETPFAKGDAIYSPTWHRRQGDAFSLLGTMDLDGDGTGDLDLLEQLISFSGGWIDNVVDEKGTLRVNGVIPNDGQPLVTKSTKFVVIGQIPEIEEGDDPQTVGRIQKILERRKELEAAAREQGVRVISLADFLPYIGFKPKRVFVPGRDVLYDLKAGGRSAMNGPFSGVKSLKSKTFSSVGPVHE